jgi:pimeloyl-ACP methyl ester carboxylesterase
MAETARGLRKDLAPVFRDVKRPVLIVRGENSKLVSPEALAKTSRLRPDLQVVVVPGADHYVNEVSPEITLKAITNFIDASPPAPPNDRIQTMPSINTSPGRTRRAEVAGGGLPD